MSWISILSPQYPTPCAISGGCHSRRLYNDQKFQQPYNQDLLKFPQPETLEIWMAIFFGTQLPSFVAFTQWVENSTPNWQSRAHNWENNTHPLVGGKQHHYRETIQQTARETDHTMVGRNSHWEHYPFISMEAEGRKVAKAAIRD